MAEGRRQAFFATNSKGSDDARSSAAIFAEVARAAGFQSVQYFGLRLNVRESNVDREVRDDFYKSQLIVLYLDLPKLGSDGEDSWALCEMPIARDQGKTCLVYTSPGFPSEVLDEYGIRDIAEPVAGPEEFRAKLTARLT